MGLEHSEVGDDDTVGGSTSKAALLRSRKLLCGTNEFQLQFFVFHGYAFLVDE